MSKVLVIGDIHAPATHPGYLQFCLDLYDEWNCNEVAFIGDVVDYQAISFHAKNPHCPGPEDEYSSANQQIKKWQEAFPRAKVCIGNHDERVLRLAESVNIPCRFLRSYQEIWETPKWDWQHEHIIDDVYYFHGTGQGGIHPAWNAAGKMLMSVVMGHCHSRAGVKWRANPQQRVFSLDTGCVDAETEYLSPTGWKQIGGYIDGMVAQYTDNGFAQFVQPLRYIARISDRMTHFETKYGVSQTLSDDHRVIYLSRGHRLLNECTAREMFMKHQADSNGFRGRFITTFTPLTLGCGWSELDLRLQIAFLADGTLGNGYPRILIKKQRKKDRLERLLLEAAIAYKRSDYDNGCSSFRFTPPSETKSLPAAWWSANTRQLKVISEESLLWDGNQYNMFDSTNIDMIDFVQYAFAASGKRARVVSGNGTKRVILSKTVNTTGIASTRKTELHVVSPPGGMEYCFTVPSGKLILRKDGCIFVTGNCGIDIDAYQFAYGRHIKERPILAAAVILDGIPYHEIMPCGRGESYHKSKFNGKK